MSTRSNVSVDETVYLVAPGVPDFVVISTTPFAARAP
jgi:hypothetical protein